ncbi:glycosyltransferase [Lentzea nigeriaca]|uniref:glycosyltransferase n=1 Tax=Lentzea nigeriaca TaxID=1128665 RepID=UPI001EF771CF|nr:hypothetical protein [Lentzea nigeriaca]MBM7857291.1 UDP:flavonoid glycosyltransferase YjiC (YdhE family) [Lentzea nigeriaca]
MLSAASVLLRSETEKDAELLVLRHEKSGLRRQLAGVNHRTRPERPYIHLTKPGQFRSVVQLLPTTVTGMRALWVPASQLGAVMPVIPVVEQLASDGHDVTAIACGALELQRSSVAAAVRFISFPTTVKHTGREEESTASSRLEHIETQDEKERRIFDRTVQEIADITAAVEMVRPDVILGDPFVMGTTLAGEILGVPVVSLIHHLFDEGASHYWPHQHVWMRRNPSSPEGFVEWWNELRGKLDLPPESRPATEAHWWPHSRDASILMTHPVVRYRARPLPAYARVAMPQMWEPTDTSDVLASIVDAMRGSQRTQVLVTTSSLWQPDNGFVWSAIQACEELGWDATTTIPSVRDPVDRVGAAHSFLPHSRLLAAADVVVTGAGLGTALRAVESRTPLLFCPSRWTNPKYRKRDTTHIAEVLTEMGVAERVFQEDMTPEVMRTALERLVSRRGNMRRRFAMFDSALRASLKSGAILDIRGLCDVIRQVAERGRVPSG